MKMRHSSSNMSFGHSPIIGTGGSSGKLSVGGSVSNLNSQSPSAIATPNASFAGAGGLMMFPNASFATNSAKIHSNSPGGPAGAASGHQGGGAMASVCRRQRRVAILSLMAMFFVAFLSFQYTSGTSGYSAEQQRKRAAAAAVVVEQRRQQGEQGEQGEQMEQGGGGGKSSSTVMKKLNNFFKPSSKQDSRKKSQLPYPKGGGGTQEEVDGEVAPDARQQQHKVRKSHLSSLAPSVSEKNKEAAGELLRIVPPSSPSPSVRNTGRGGVRPRHPAKSRVKPGFNSLVEACPDPAEVRAELQVDKAPTTSDDLQQRLWSALTAGDSVSDLAATKANTAVGVLRRKVKDHLRSLALVYVGDSTALRSFYGSRLLLSNIVEAYKKNHHQEGDGGADATKKSKGEEELSTTYKLECGDNVQDYERVKLAPRFMWCAIVEEVKPEHWQPVVGGDGENTPPASTTTIAAFVAFYKVIWLKDMARGMENLSTALLSSGSREKDVELDDAGGASTPTTAASAGLIEVELLPSFVRNSLRSARRRITLVWSVGLWDLVRPTIAIHGFDATQEWNTTNQLGKYQVYASDALSAAYRVVDSLHGHHFLLLVRPPPIVNCSADRFTKVEAYAERCRNFLYPSGLPMLQTMYRLILFNGDASNDKLLLPTKGRTALVSGAGDIVSPEHEAKEALGVCTFSDGVHADAGYGSPCFVSEQWSVWLHTFLGGGLC